MSQDQSKKLLTDFIQAALPNAEVLYRVHHPEHLLALSDNSAHPSYFVLTGSVNGQSLRPEAESLAAKVNELFGKETSQATVLDTTTVHPDLREFLPTDDHWTDKNTMFVGMRLTGSLR